MFAHYPAEFKQQAVELPTISRKSITQAALELRIPKVSFTIGSTTRVKDLEGKKVIHGSNPGDQRTSRTK